METIAVCGGGIVVVEDLDLVITEGNMTVGSTGNDETGINNAIVVIINNSISINSLILRRPIRRELERPFVSEREVFVVMAGVRWCGAAAAGGYTRMPSPWVAKNGSARFRSVVPVHTGRS